MEFQEFFKQHERMCKLYKKCNSCPIGNSGVSCQRIVPEDNAIKLEQIVEQWAKENPIPTNKDKFQEVFGQMPSSLVCLFVDNKLKCGSCSECEYNDWWEKEYKLPKGEEV